MMGGSGVGLRSGKYLILLVSYIAVNDVMACALECKFHMYAIAIL